jgi:integrase
MARMIGRLSPVRVRTAKPPRGAQSATLYDGGCLALQLTTGRDGYVRRSWVFRYQLRGARHELGLGNLDTFSLAEARDRARALRQQLADGLDPLAERRRREQAVAAEAAKRVTFKQCAEEYFRAHGDGWRSDKHRRQWFASLQQYAFPALGTLAVADIEVGHVLRALEPIWRAKTVTATRVANRIEKVLGLAIARGYRTNNVNPAQWRGLLATLLPAKNKLRTVKHHRALPYTRMPEFMAALRKRDSEAARCLEFLALTACRPGEAVGCKWDEINLREKVWVIPAGRMKAHREHRVPLSPAALALLAGIKHRDGRVFACGATSLLDALRAMQVDTVPHGFRASFRTWATERTSIPHEVIEQALAHVVSDATVRAYKRTDLFDRRRKLMDAWARYCAAPALEGEVVPLRSAEHG